MKIGEIKMDYKEEYQKALERAKKGLPIDEVFPELKETKDERIKREIIEYIEAFANAKNEKIPTEWLDWLEKQKEQKTAEWNDEDEEMIERICANLEYLIKEAGCDSQVTGKLEKRIKWLRRLKALLSQPHWKPSEEQMDALKNARHMMGQSGDYYDTTAIIDSLITDLQKLL